MNTAKCRYSWSYGPEVAHLFSKNLSEHGSPAYVELCSGVGISFEATTSLDAKNAKRQLRAILPRQSQQPRQSRQLHQYHHGEYVTTRRVGEEKPLGKTNTLLARMAQLQETLDVEEARTRQSEENLEAARAECHRLSWECMEMSDQCITREILLCKCLSTLDSIPAYLAELRGEICQAIGQNAFTASET